jgi:glycine/D-amino acid oxidase-like deaminating enzyme
MTRDCTTLSGEPAMASSRHVIVCGAGVVGASVAYFLTRRGVRVTVIERTGVACAASGKSGGFLALDWCDNTPVEGLARASFALHATLARELGVDYGYRRMDTYVAAARETGRVGGRHRGPSPAWIDGPAVVGGALGTTETTAQVHPARFTEALVDAARRDGAIVHTGVVEAVAVRDGVAHGVVVNGHTHEADAVVLALGPWTGRVEGVRLPRIHGLKGYSVTLDAPDVPPDAVFMDYRTADGLALEPEIIPRPDGTVYVCGMADRQPLPESAEGVEVSEAGCAVLARAAGRLSATLAAAAITRRQACYRPVTDDGIPIIGPVPGARGAYVATGHGPWGMLNAPATGLALAELITDGAARAVDLEPLGPARLRTASPASRGG